MCEPRLTSQSDLLRRRHPPMPGPAPGAGGCRAAFTIVELMVVITIIVLLVAMILPRYGHAREIARRSICAANSRGHVIACDSYSVSNNSFFPPAIKGSHWAWSFDLRTSNTNPRIPLGIGILAAGGKYMEYDPKVFHCPSMNTSGATEFSTPYHSMDVTIPNWWGSVGASNWFDPAYAGYRITIAYSYRGSSWAIKNPTAPLIRVGKMPAGFVINSDILDPRFGKKYTHRDGYNFTRIDESTAWRNDDDNEIELYARSHGVNVDGRNNAILQDEVLIPTYFEQN